jgi:NADH-quinone oxidoreductase subunit E
MAEIQDFVHQLAEKHGRERGSLLPILQECVEKYRGLTAESIVEIAREMDLSAAEVYGTASFYSFINFDKQGRYVIRVCKSIIAEMKGKKEIVKKLEDILKIKVGETTQDGLFTLLETNDIGWSDQEPSMLINDQPYTNLTTEKVSHIIAQLRKH